MPAGSSSAAAATGSGCRRVLPSKKAAATEVTQAAAQIQQLRVEPQIVGKGKLQELAAGTGMETHPDTQSSHPLTPAGKETRLSASVFAAGCDRA